MTSRNPAKDLVAIVGCATTPYVRDRGRSLSAMTLEACVGAIRDAGLGAADIDAIVGSTSTIPAHEVQSGLGIPACTWWANMPIPFTAQVIAAVQAVHSGFCETVLAYHATYRSAGTSRAAGHDPFRSRSGPGLNKLSASPDTIAGAVGYAAWASRYLHEFGRTREDFGLVAINGRSNAALNPHAALRAPLTMDDYLTARMVRHPLSMLDMDYPIDGADAFVITSAERARDLPGQAVLVHAATLGMTGHCLEEETSSLTDTGQQVVARNLWARSDLTLDDIDIYFPYDGFTVITLRCFETIGYCGDGEAGDFLRSNWDPATGRVQINGRVLVNPHGGSLSEGGTQGSGHVREAVDQLRGRAGARQAPGVKHALVTPGGFFFTAGGLILRTE